MKDNYNKKIFFFLVIIIFFFLIKADFVLALETQYPPIFGLSVGSGTLPEYARYLFNIGMAMAGILAVIVIALGGIYYLASLGMGKFTDEGKQWVKAGVLGLILTVSSYLIASTINPNLVVFNFKELLPISFSNLISPPSSGTTPLVYYDEIPVGILTESLLSRTMDCYDFNGNGDPIEDPIKTDNHGVINGPTLLNHDRVDCLLKLIEAAEKKSKLIKNLSDEIVKLMEQCSCAGKCDDTCDISYPGACDPPVNGQCSTGSCVGAACKPFPQGSNDCCPPGVKDQIEHGPIEINHQYFKGLDEFRTPLISVVNLVEIQPNPTMNGKEITIIDNSKWVNLKLIEQLIYFEEKMNQIKSKIKVDRGQLQSAENTLGQCYLAEPYIDFLKTVEKTKKENKTIMVQKTFNDPETQKLINIDKYCKGFDYANSKAYMKCQNICPETLKDKTCYQACNNCNEQNPQAQAQCIKNQTQCIKDCYNNRKCPVQANTTSTNPTNNPPFNPATFKDCIQGLNQQCLDLCDKKYTLSPSNELTECQAKCGNDTSSKCLLDNEEKCTVNFLQLKTCSDDHSDPDNLKNCINNSFLCKYGSEEYAGYPDCVKNQGPYSSPFLYQNPDNQKCKNPYKRYTAGANAGQTCLGLYPETAKCPTASRCPKCPCGIVSDAESNLEYQVVTGTCSEFSYNDDPLTFYCQQNWWDKENKVEEKKPTPIGGEKVCSKENEIPVGQTIDDAEKWANELAKNVDNFIQTIEDMIRYIEKIVQEQKYCQCDSTCENGLPCSTSCQYVPQIDTPIYSPESCVAQSCDGIACQKMINLLKGGSTPNCPVEKDGIPYYYDKIYQEFKIFYKFIVVDQRTDILKELSYSRKKINEASTAQSAFGGEIKILNCERVQDHIISPIQEGKIRIDNKTIKSYCYGKVLGKILQTQEPMADNWFYCEERQGINQ